MVKEKIMIVDDEKQIIDLIYMYLIREGFQVISAQNGEDALRLSLKENPDLIILDILLPGQDGIEVCTKLRKNTDVPILFLSCKNQDMDKILGLSIGGDDYITKPFSPNVLLARIKAHLRRTHLQSEHTSNKKILNYSDLKIDLDSRTVFVNDSLVELTTKEFDIITLLAKNPNRVFYTSQIFENIWNTYSLDYDIRTVMVHISNIRKKIEQDPTNPKYIITVRGIGYKFNGNYLTH